MEPLTLEEIWASALADAALKWRKACEEKEGAGSSQPDRARDTTRCGESKTHTGTRTSTTCIDTERPA